MNGRTAFIAAVFLVTALAGGLRLIAVQYLPIDHDEDDYLGAAIHYANALRAGDLSEIINYDFNFEHPPLIKLFYGAAIAPLPEAPLTAEKPASAPIAASLPEPHFRYARLQSAFFGTLEVFMLALLNPLAGLFLAINTWQIKYTSQIMLEALPSFTSLLAVFAYLKSQRRWNLWLLLSSVSFGLTVAAKFPYGIAGIAILLDWLARDRQEGVTIRSPLGERWLRWILLWSGIAILVFLAVNPRLWVDAVGRLFQAVQYHWDYAHSARVREVAYPIWQPLVWLFMPVPWHSSVFLVKMDVWITLLALLGFRPAWRHQRVFALWLGLSLIFLILWPTKWPQYILLLTAPLCYCAACGFKAVVSDPFSHWLHRQQEKLCPSCKAGSQVDLCVSRYPDSLPGPVDECTGRDHLHVPVPLSQEGPPGWYN